MSADKIPFMAKGLGAASELKYDVKTLENGSTILQPYVKSAKDELLDYASFKSPHFKVSPKACMEVKKSKSGVASAGSSTVMERFKQAVKRHGNDLAMVSATDKKYTWKQYYKQTQLVAKGLIKLGVPKFGCVNIIGFNSPEWLIMNLAAVAAGAKAAGIYTTNAPDACRYISDHSKATVVACEDEEQLKKFLEIRSSLPYLEAIVMWSGKVPEGVNDTEGVAKVYSWKELIEMGKSADETIETELKSRQDSMQSGDACTLIYTSGTTGNPKAVMVSHDNALWVAQSLYCTSDDIFAQTDERIISYLPLSHIAAQILDIYTPLLSAGMLRSNCTIYFADKMALKGTLLQTLQKVHPTLFFGVPRVWEKFAEKMKEKGKDTKGIKKKLLMWAKGKGLQNFNNFQVGGSYKKPQHFGFANVFLKKIQQAIGLDQCRIATTGAAPINVETLNFFGALNIRILELYGMSECTGPHSINNQTRGGHKVGSIGLPLPGTETMIAHVAGRDKEGEGEICFRGRHIMMGYMDDEAKTKGAIDEDGWLHSGDVGRVDKNGMLYITGRIKELIITAGGENIAPVPIEEDIKSACPGISNFMMVGDKRKYNTALVTLKTEPNDDGTFANELANEATSVNPKVKTVAEAQKDEKWKAYIQSGIDKHNASAVSNAAKIQKFVILDKDFSVPGGELGPTLKLKRPVVTEMYAAQIESMY